MVEEGRLLGGGIIRRPCLLESIYQRPLKIRLPFGNASVTVQDPEGPRCYEERAGRLPWGVVSAWPRRPAWGTPPRSGRVSQKAQVSRCLPSLGSSRCGLWLRAPEPGCRPGVGAFDLWSSCSLVTACLPAYAGRLADWLSDASLDLRPFAEDRAADPDMGRA